MKKETLKDQTNQDGSQTRVEKITQTPEDGFVSNREHRPEWEHRDYEVGMFKEGHFKGKKTTVIYRKTHTKKTRILFYALYLIVALIFSAIFLALIAAQDTSEGANKCKVYFAGVMVFLLYGLVQSVLSFRKQDRKKQQEDEEDQTRER